MEVKSTIHGNVAVRFYVLMLLFLALSTGKLFAQQAAVYKVKNGKMYIEMSRQIGLSRLDSFILEYDLSDLGLRQFFNHNQADSLEKFGWHVEKNNKQGFVISKPLVPLDDVVS
ncbi:MAG: hypothetical protein ACJ749_20195, partial [Flavisolibacter sp.]